MGRKHEDGADFAKRMGVRSIVPGEYVSIHGPPKLAGGHRYAPPAATVFRHPDGNHNAGEGTRRASTNQPLSGNMQSLLEWCL